MKNRFLQRLGCGVAIILMLSQLTVVQVQAQSGETAAAGAVTPQETVPVNESLPAEPSELAPQAIETLTILHTNDMHGHIEQDATAADGGTIGAALYKSIINDYESKGNVLVFDAGDATHGTNFATISDGENIISLMNDLGVDGFVPGNHDFNYGFAQLMNLQSLAAFPMLASNVVEDATGTDPFAENKIIDMGTYQVGVFGMATPETKTKSNPLNTSGLTFADVVATANAQVAALTLAGADVIIMLSHLGEDASSPINTFTVTSQVTGIDLIIDGHSHTLLPAGQLEGSTMIASAGEHMKNIGHVVITVSEEAVTGITADLITFDQAAAYTADPAIQAKINALDAENSEVLNVVVGSTTSELDGLRDHVRVGETNLGDLITDAMIADSGADVALTNGGGIRASIDAGDITMGEVLTVLPFGNLLTVIKVTGQDIIDALTFGVSDYPKSAGKFPHVAGMSYQIIVESGGNKVTNVLIAGIPVDPAQTYNLATNDFMAVGGDGYTMFEGKEQVSLNGSLADILAEFITDLTAQNGAVTYVKGSRITLAPTPTPTAAPTTAAATATPAAKIDAEAIVQTGESTAYQVQIGAALVVCASALVIIIKKSKKQSVK